MFLCKTISGELSGNGAHARNQMTHIADSQYATRVSLDAPCTVRALLCFETQHDAPPGGH